MTLHEKADISKTIIELAIKLYPKIFAACSFGKDSRVIIDLVTKVKPSLPFAGIDTGYEFEETLEYGNSLIKELNLDFTWLRPSEEAKARIDKEYGNEFIKNDQYKCCEMKIPAVEGFLPKFDAWITGLRRDETKYRANTPIVEYGKIVKINPIAFWTQDDVWQHIRENNLRYHPLYNQGYPSLGCKPCTTQGKTREGGGRQGRFEKAGQ